jgi:hypothetical protein
MSAGSEHPSKDTPSMEKPSAAWYLLPIFLSWLGGLIMHFAIRDRSKAMAKKGLILGLVLTAARVAIYLAVSLSVRAFF